MQNDSLLGIIGPQSFTSTIRKLQSYPQVTLPYCILHHPYTRPIRFQPLFLHLVLDFLVESLE
jgi:hypothetical protein